MQKQWLYKISSAMSIVALALAALPVRPAYAAAKVASVTGNWSAAATWGGGAPPVAGDTCTINSNITVTVDVAIATCDSITITTQAVAGTHALAVGANTLNTGSIAITGSATAGRFSSVTISTGIVNVTGNVSFAGTPAQARVVFTGAGTLNIGGNLGAGGTLTASTGTVNFNGAAAQSTGAYTYNNLNIGAGTTLNTANNALTINGNFTNAGTFTAGSSNITIGGAVAQSIAGFTTTGIVSMRKTAGIATMTGDLNAGSLTINGVGGTLGIAAFNGNMGVVTLLNGTITGTTGVLTGTSYDVQNGTASVILGGTGVALTKTTAGTVTLSGANTFTGGATLNAGTLNINNATAIGSGTFTINGGSINNSTAAAITLSTNNAQNWNGDFAFAGTRNLDLGIGAVTLSAARTVTVTANTLTVGGVISGAFGLTKAGTGILTLAGTNTFTGGATLSAGTLNINNATAIGSGTFTITAGTVNNTSGGAITLSNNNAQNWNGNFTFTGTNNLNLGIGAVTLSAARTVTVTANTLTVGGVISGAFRLTKAGAGTLTLAGTNTFTGGATLSAGTLNINNATAIGSGTFTITAGTVNNTSGGAITLSNNNAQNWNGNFTFTGTNNLNLGTGAVTLSAARTVTVTANTLTVGGVISGAFRLTKAGAGTLTLTGTNTFTGGTTLSAGTLNINNAQALGTVAGTLIITGGTINNTSGAAITTLNYPQNWNGNFTFTGTNNLDLGTGAVTLSAARTVTVTANTLTVGGVISGAFRLTKAGAGTLTLTGTNTFTGGTTLSAGTLNINNAQALGTVAGTFIITGGTINNTSGAAITTLNYPQNWNGNFIFTGTNNLDLGTGAVTLSAARTVTVTANTLTVGGVISGAFRLTKAGAGTLTLTGTNTFTGGTTLSAGTLNINNAQALGTVAGTFIITGGTINNTSGAAITTLNYPQNWNGNFIFTGTNNLDLGTGAVTLSAARTVTVTADTLTVGGVISGAFRLTKAGAGTLTLTGTNTFTGGTTLSAGTLNINNAQALGTVAGTLIITGGTINNTSGAAITTLNYPQTWGGDFTFTGTQNLNLGTGAVAMSASRLVTVGAGTLTVGGTITPGTLDLTKAGVGTLSFGANTVTLRALTISAGTLTSTSGTMNLVGDFTNNGTFNHNNGTVIFNGAVAQNINGTIATTFNNLTDGNTLAGGAGLSLNGVDATVTNTLALAANKLTTGANTIILNLATGLTRTTGFVIGNLRKPIAGGSPTIVYEVGTGNSYTPMSVAFTGVSAGGETITGSSTAGLHPQYISSSLSTTKYVNRYWTLIPSAGLTFTNYTPTFTYNPAVSPAGDLVGGPNTNALIVRKYNAGWTAPASSSSVSPTVKGTNFTMSFGDYAAGEGNTPPVLAAIEGAALGYTENQAATAITATTTATDADSLTLASGNVSITTNFASGQDVLAFTNVPATMGNIAGSYNAVTGVMTLTSAGATATVAQWQVAIRAVTYANTSDAPSTLARTVSFTLSDGVANSNTVTRDITITAVNDVPTITAPVSIGVTEDVVSALTGISFSDVDAGASNVTATLSVPSGFLAATSAGGVTVGGTSSALTLTGSTANISAFITAGNVTFITSLNATANVTLTVDINDGGNTGTGGAQTASTTVTLTVTAVNDAPTVANSVPDQNATEDSPFSFTFAANTFHDVDIGDTLTYSATLSDGSPLPGWLSFTPLTRAFSGMPLNSDVGVITVRVTATDTSAASIFDDFDITAQNTNDAPTDISLSASSFAENNAINDVIGTLSATDPDTGDTFAFALNCSSAGTDDLSFNINGTDLRASAVFDYETKISYNICVRVTDQGGTGLTFDKNFTITITNVDTAPSIDSPAPLAGTVGVPYNHTFTATGDPALTFNLSGTLPAGLTFSMDTISGSPTTAGTSGSITVTATNGILPNATQTFTITINPLPSVTKINSVADTGDGQVVENEHTSVAVTQLLVVFNNDMNTTEVVDPANYTLVENGTTNITIAPPAITYNILTKTATLSINGGVALSDGNYALTVKSSLHDTAGYAPPADFVRKFVIDTTAPQVAASGIGTVPDTGDGVLTEFEVATVGITKFLVTFNEDLVNVGIGDPQYGNSVINPANYMLIRDLGDTAGFQTVSCALPGAVVPADTKIDISDVTYDNSTHVATFTVNGGLPLSNGNYQLYVCGSTSITNLAGIELAGDGTRPGTDRIRNFIVSISGGGGGNNRDGRGKNSGKDPQTSTTGGLLIPVTGFAQDQVTLLPVQPADKVYKPLDEIRIDIPTLGINFPIVGVSFIKNNWDLTWLNGKVGYLEGSAYPTFSGNTVLTAHVTDANNNLGPFSDIKGMKLGDKIYLHAYGRVYVYQVQENRKVLPTSISAVFKHEEYNWVTLVTCEDYNIKTKTYDYRRMVRAVLISVISEK